MMQLGIKTVKVQARSLIVAVKTMKKIFLKEIYTVLADYIDLFIH